MEEKEKKTKKKKKKHSKSSPDISFKPSSDVKGLKFGGQIIVKSFTIRRARTLELLKLISIPSSASLLSTAAYLPTNFTILAHHAWHTLTLGLGTRKSKVVVFVFESEAMKTAVTAEGGIWPPEISLGDVNKKIKELGDGEVQIQERMHHVLRLHREKHRKRRFHGGGGLKGNFTGGGCFKRFHGSHRNARNAPPESY